MFTNKFELIQTAAVRANFTQAAMKKALEAIMSTIVDHVSIGEDVRINDFGTFYRDHRNARLGRNPSTKEAVPIPERNLPAFKPGKEFIQITAEMSKPRER